MRFQSRVFLIAVALVLGVGAVFMAYLATGLPRGRPVARIGYLSGGTPESGRPNLDALRQGLAELGYVEGSTIVIEDRYTEGRNERATELVAELLKRKVDVLVTIATPATRAAMQATNTVPIVFASVSDPVGTGLVASLSRPGGNVTGFSSFAPAMNGKSLELLKELLPNLRRVALLTDATNVRTPEQQAAIADAASRLGLHLIPVRANGPDGLPAAFSEIAEGGAEAFLDVGCPMTCTHHRRVLELAQAHGLPGMFGFSVFVRAGGLMSYSVNDRALLRGAATYVDRLIRGARPHELPVQQPISFELAINKRTAQALSLWPPPAVIQAQLTEVIE
jgi:putative ABC transport system substrate-binding protein